MLAAQEMTRTALQRQYRHLASLLAAEPNVADIRAALAGELQPHAYESATLIQAERWRDRLLSADDSQLAAFMERFPGCDRTLVRQLVRNARKEQELEKPPRSARKLFRYIKQLSDPQD